MVNGPAGGASVPPPQCLFLVGTPNMSHKILSKRPLSSSTINAPNKETNYSVRNDDRDSAIDM